MSYFFRRHYPSIIVSCLILYTLVAACTQKLSFVTQYNILIGLTMGILILLFIIYITAVRPIEFEHTYIKKQKRK